MMPPAYTSTCTAATNSAPFITNSTATQRNVSRRNSAECTGLRIEITRIDDALTATGPSSGTPIPTGSAINDPLGLAIAPNGDILTTNGGDGNLVETTQAGQQVAVQTLDDSTQPSGPPGNGTLFGLAVAPAGAGVYFVDDGMNTLNILH